MHKSSLPLFMVISKRVPPLANRFSRRGYKNWNLFNCISITFIFGSIHISGIAVKYFPGEHFSNAIVSVFHVQPTSNNPCVYAKTF